MSLSASSRVRNSWCSRLASNSAKARNDSRSSAGSSSAHIVTMLVLRNGMNRSPVIAGPFYSAEPRVPSTSGWIRAGRHERVVGMSQCDRAEVPLIDGEPWCGPWRSVALADFAGGLPRVPHDGRPAVVAVDGRSASGKTTLAARLVEAVPHAHLVHTDDIAWWHSFFDWVELMRYRVLQPLHRGSAVI